jgi:hypothetical protein
VVFAAVLGIGCGRGKKGETKEEKIRNVFKSAAVKTKAESLERSFKDISMKLPPSLLPLLEAIKTEKLISTFLEAKKS